MAKLDYKTVYDGLDEHGWKLLSEEYKNLKTPLQLECPEGHKLSLTWEQVRKDFKCPICELNPYKTEDDGKVIPKPRNAIRVIGFDQATHDCGWAVFDDGKPVKYGVQHFSRGLPEDQRINAIKRWMISMIKNWGPSRVAFEGIQYQEDSIGPDGVTRHKMGVTVFQTLARLQGVLFDTCIELGMPYLLVPTNTWRNFCGVKGRTRPDKKKSMMLLAKEWYDITVTNDEADAIGIAKYCAENGSASQVKISEWE